MMREMAYKQARKQNKKKEVKTLYGICIAKNIRHSGLEKWSTVTLEMN